MSCYEPMCDDEIEASCSCTSPPIYFCKAHLSKHYQYSIASHNITSVFEEPAEGTKQAILNFLTAQNSMTDAIKIAAFSSFCKTIFNLEKAFKETIKEIDSDLTKFQKYFDKVWKIKKISKLERDPVLKLLTLQSYEAIEKIKAILSIKNNYDSFSSMECLIDQVLANFIDEKSKSFENEKHVKIEKSDLSYENMKALKKYKEITSVYHNNSDAYNGMGDIYYREMRYKEALKYYDIACKIDPSNAAFYVNKGLAYRELGKREKAMKCFENAIKIDPNQDKAHNGIGTIFYDENIYEEARKYYQNAIIINPSCTDYWINQGNTLTKLERIEEATKCFKKAQSMKLH